MKHSKLAGLFNEHRALLLFIFLMLVFRSSIADWNDVPTGSMKPTIVEGDRILVNKIAYDVRVPLTQISLYKLADPERGDIVIFDSAVSNKRLVKRVIGLPGDQVSMVNNRVSVNGVQLQYASTVGNEGIDWIEQLPNTSYNVRIPYSAPAQSNFSQTTVPVGHYLVLGDNRNNSADSRAIGFIPRSEIVGRAHRVAFSLDYDNFYLPRSERLLKAL